MEIGLNETSSDRRGSESGQIVHHKIEING